MAAVALVCMPWHVLRSPSIQIGTLRSVLHRRGITCVTHSLHVQFAHFATRLCRERARLSLQEYFDLGERWFMCGAGEWVFAQPSVRPPDKPEELRYLAHLRHQRMPRALQSRLVALRAEVPAFLEACADEVLAGGPALVGFTTTFGQTVPSLALAAVIKRRDPRIRIVFGGSNCEGPMGEALLREFDCVDFVVRGEGEVALPALVESVLAGAPPPPLPGLCYRDGGNPVAVAERESPGVAMDEVPAPEYDEYFLRLGRLGLANEVVPVLPYESSRGCWWGAKSHCTFCGLNGKLMAHRSKSPDRVVPELLELARRYAVLDFAIVDNILDLGYFDSVLPALRDAGLHLRIFWQTKANLSVDQVRSLREAGVSAIRPGIESLSTPVLQLMRKGVSALQNIRLLKWCAQHGVHVAWNVIYGLPFEPRAEYERMASTARWLVHLSPPALVPLTLDRFSPYHAHQARHGIRAVGPPRHYRALFGRNDAALVDLAWTFEHELTEPADPEAYVAPLRREVERWRADTHRNQGALTYRRGPGCLVITDRRTTVGHRRYVLDELEARIYLGCDAGAEPNALAGHVSRALGREIDAASVQKTLAELAGEHLLYEEDGHYLSLAIPEGGAAVVTPSP